MVVGTDAGAGASEPGLFATESTDDQCGRCAGARAYAVRECATGRRRALRVRPARAEHGEQRRPASAPGARDTAFTQCARDGTVRLSAAGAADRTDCRAIRSAHGAQAAQVIAGAAA